MNNVALLIPILLGIACVRKPELFQSRRWTAESFVVIRGMGVAMVAVSLALMIVAR